VKEKAVAILCAATKSVYHEMDGLDVYDITRDARTFPGGMPIVAHPPCRGWSQYAANMGHVPIPEERELGLWCCEQLRGCGGVLEQPQGSTLFEAAGFHDDPDVYCTFVQQSWWGYPIRKGTWLAFVGIDPKLIEVPLRLGVLPTRAFWDSKRSLRSATTRGFAEWLVALARIAHEREDDGTLGQPDPA